MLAAIGGIFYWYQTARAAVGNLNLYEGSTSVIRRGKTIEGRTGTGIRPSDVLKIGEDSRVSIILHDGSVIRLEAGSELEVGELTYKGNKLKNGLFRLKFGRAWSKVEPLEPGSSYTVETPSVVAAVRGTSFNVGYLEKTSKVYTRSGKVLVAVLAKQDLFKQVTDGNFFKLADDDLKNNFEIGPSEAPIDFIDEWIKFNMGEDARLEGKSSEVIQENGKPSALPQETRKPMEEQSKTLSRVKVTYIKMGAASNQTGNSLLGAQFAAIAYYEDGTSADVTTKALWSVIGTAGGSINPVGFYIPSGKGVGNVTAIFQNIKVTVYIDVP